MMDKTAFKARKEGYRARSVYKLFQINKRFQIIKKDDQVLDLGCFPGSWCQAAMRLGAHPLGMDKKTIRSIPGVKFIKGDVMKNESFIGLGKFDIILSDLSPNISGILEVDKNKSLNLILRVLEIADNHLKKNGNLVTKFFQSENTSYIFNLFRKKFRIVKIYKPQSSKKRSKESYIIAKNFR